MHYCLRPSHGKPAPLFYRGIRLRAMVARRETGAFTLSLSASAFAVGRAHVSVAAPPPSPSGAAATQTLSSSCSVLGGCTDTVASFPPTAIPGDARSVKADARATGSSVDAFCPAPTPALSPEHSRGRIP